MSKSNSSPVGAREFWISESKQDIQTYDYTVNEDMQYEDDIHVIEKHAYLDLKEKYFKLEKHIIECREKRVELAKQVYELKQEVESLKVQLDSAFDRF